MPMRRMKKVFTGAEMVTSIRRLLSGSWMGVTVTPPPLV